MDSVLRAPFSSGTLEYYVWPEEVTTWGIPRIWVCACGWRLRSDLEGSAYLLSDHNWGSGCGATMNECSMWWRSALERTFNSKTAWWSWKGFWLVSIQVLTKDRSFTHDSTLRILSNYLRAGKWRNGDLNPGLSGPEPVLTNTLL